LNIFALDTDPRLAAQAHADTHVVKMILETAQLLSTAHHVLDPDNAPEGIYKVTHRNHPSAVWVRQSGENYWWTFRLFCELNNEYRHRYHRNHASGRLYEALRCIPEPLWIGNSNDWDPLTPVTPAMPDEFKLFPNPDTFEQSVTNYRNYYKHGKAHLHRWTRRPKPTWID
jgi:hypothetical protein